MDWKQTPHLKDWTSLKPLRMCCDGERPLENIINNNNNNNINNNDNILYLQPSLTAYRAHRAYSSIESCPRAR